MKRQRTKDSDLSGTSGSRFHLDNSTFDMVDMQLFRNFRFSTLFWYVWNLAMIILSIALLAVDIYTCLNIFVFKKWGTDESVGVIPYNINVAKWIFTGCIIFQFCLLVYNWIFCFRAMRGNKIALVYLNQYARHLYTVKLYNLFCLFNLINYNSYFDWACFYAHEQAGNALQLLVADAPRQVVNILTLRQYATKYSGNVLDNIEIIANHNVRLAVLLSLIILSVVIWCFFIFMFIYGMCIYPIVWVKLRRHYGQLIKQYCTDVVNMLVREIVRKYHLSQEELLNRGVMDKRQIYANPLLHSTTTEFRHVVHHDNEKLQQISEDSYSVLLFEEEIKPLDMTQIPVPQRAGSLSSLSYTRPINPHSSQTDLLRRKPPPDFDPIRNVVRLNPPQQRPFSPPATRTFTAPLVAANVGPSMSQLSTGTFTQPFPPPQLDSYAPPPSQPSATSFTPPPMSQLSTTTFTAPPLSQLSTTTFTAPPMSQLSTLTSMSNQPTGQRGFTGLQSVPVPTYDPDQQYYGGYPGSSTEYYRPDHLYPAPPAPTYNNPLHAGSLTSLTDLASGSPPSDDAFTPYPVRGVSMYGDDVSRSNSYTYPQH